MPIKRPGMPRKGRGRKLIFVSLRNAERLKLKSGERKRSRSQKFAKEFQNKNSTKTYFSKKLPKDDFKFPE